MTVKLKAIVAVISFFSFFSGVSWGVDSISPDDLIVYPKDNKESAKRRIVQVLDGAEKSIDMAAYQVKDPDIADALVRKAKQGVQVRLLVETNPYEHDFNKAVQDEQIEKIKKAGVTIHGRPEMLKEKYPNGHMHARYIIIDGRKFILTTGNFDEQTFDHCRDFAIVVNKNQENSKQFQLIEQIFDGDCNNKPITIPGTELSIILGPEGQREKIAQFLKTATKKIQIYQQYCNDEKMTDILLDLKKKGVEIQVLMMAYPTSYDKDPNQATQDKLINAGIEVKLVDVNLQTYMHARTIIVDEARASFGTASLSPPSLDSNTELTLIINGKTVKALCQWIEKDLSQALSVEEGRKKSLEKKLDWNQKFSKS